ncbi:hypothetical protein ACXR8U_08240 [Methylobacterium radiotolerans]|jgi:hypothetical protein|uniref:hypothetical protein n=1 Tax=Methylobacterium TaxID=407 RepID=UPI0005E6DE64|nr:MULTISPECIES: hypothetical protein [Methylobacterium]KZC03577.1 hypothetical protein AU375_00169 [Methylobacterium radiotolerans]MBN6821640.1 hypothetical protein [Methylobacterium organophilum]GAN52372.1 hypothetical protein ME121_6509 [Methylobacterium sp. ME121]
MADEDRDPSRDETIAGLVRRLDGFARGLGLDEAATRRIVEQVAVDMAMRGLAPV